MSKPAAKTTDERFEHIQAFFDTTRGQITIGEIPPIRRAALAAVGKTARVALVCADTESVSDLLQRLNVALGKAAQENIVIDEVLPEIKRRAGRNYRNARGHGHTLTLICAVTRICECDAPLKTEHLAPRARY